MIDTVTNETTNQEYETSLYKSNALTYNEVWLFRNAVRDSLESKREQIKTFVDMEHRGHNLGNVLDACIGEYYDLLDCALRRLVSDTWRREDLIRWFYPDVIC